MHDDVVDPRPDTSSPRIKAAVFRRPHGIEKPVRAVFGAPSSPCGLACRRMGSHA